MILIVESSPAEDFVSLRTGFKALKPLGPSFCRSIFARFSGQPQTSGMVTATGPIGKSWSSFIAIFILFSRFVISTKESICNIVCFSKVSLMLLLLGKGGAAKLLFVVKIIGVLNSFGKT